MHIYIYIYRSLQGHIRVSGVGVRLRVEDKGCECIGERVPALSFRHSTLPQYEHQLDLRFVITLDPKQGHGVSVPQLKAAANSAGQQAIW